MPWERMGENRGFIFIMRDFAAGRRQAEACEAWLDGLEEHLGARRPRITIYEHRWRLRTATATVRGDRRPNPLGSANGERSVSFSGRRVFAARSALCVLLAWRLLVGPWEEVAGRADGLYRPVGVMHLFPSMPGEGVAVAAMIAGVVAALIAACGLWLRVSLPLALASAVLLNSMWSSTGKIMHNSVLVVLCLIPFAAAAFSESHRRLRHHRDEASEAFGWPLALAMVVVAGAYFFAGAVKLWHSGLDWATSDNMRWILYAASDKQADPNPIGLFIADHDLLAHLLAGGTLFLEVTFPVVLVWSAARWFYVPGAVFLHAGIYITMDLDYWAQALAIVAVFVDWDRLSRQRPP